MSVWTMPKDFARTGASSLQFEPTHMRLYASLTPEQRALAWASGVPYSRMTRKQRRLFEKLSSTYAEQLSADAAIPDSFRIETEKEQKPLNVWKILTFMYSFKGLPPIERSVNVNAIDKSELKQVATKPPTPAAPPPIPSEPKSLVAAAALAKWSYVALRPETGTSEIRAVVETKAGDETKRRLLSVGKALEGAKLTEIEPEGLTFGFDGATLTLPASRAVSLEPYDIRAISHGDGWVDYFGKLMDY